MKTSKFISNNNLQVSTLEDPNQNEGIEQLQNPNYFEFSNYHLKVQNQLPYIQLRGGGCCGATKAHQNLIYEDKQLEENFASNLEKFTNIIVEKSLSFQDKLYQDEVLSAFQWFYNHKQQFHILCQEESLVLKNYELIEKITEQLLKQLTIYIKLSGFLFYTLLQICNDLFRIIFSYQLKNEERYMQEDLKQKFLGYISEIESQISVEAINIWLNGVEFELQMIKTCIAHCRTNSGKGKELAISILCGLMSSISQLKPSDELINSLIEGGKFLLLNFYDKKIQNPLEIYEIYFFFENLKWQILNQLRLGYSTQNIIKQLQDGYSKYIKFSKDWMVHYCWVNLVSDLMCYRPIIHKNQLAYLLQQGTTEQEVWERLINQSQIIQLPYDKFAGKLIIFKKSNVIFKKFRTFKLFQEYLIQNQTDTQLLPNYINFNFNENKGQQITHEDLFIQQLANQSNLELLKALIAQLVSIKEQLLSNLEALKLQINQYNSQLQNNKLLEIKISRQDVMFQMCQIKQSSFLLYCLLNEICLLINKELSMNSIFQTILQGTSENLSEKQKQQKQKSLTVIKEIENKHSTEFLNNLQIVSRFWIQICQFTTISHEELIVGKLEMEEPLESKISQNIIIITNIINYLDKFVEQQVSIKRNCLSILEQKQFQGFMKEPISQIRIASQIIKLLNPNLILALVNEILEHFKVLQKEKLNIEKVSDIRTILIMIYSNLNIYKGLRIILKLHQRKLISLSAQLQGVFANKSIQAEGQIQNQNDINEYIKSQILDKKDCLQMLFKKYQNVEFTKDIQIDFNNISNQIIKEKNEILNKDWDESIKADYLLLLSKIKTKLGLICLVQENKVVIQQEIIRLLDTKLYDLNQVDKTENIVQLAKVQVQLDQVEILKLQMKDIFDCESPIQMIEDLISKSKILKEIIQCHLPDTTSQDQQINLSLLNNLKNNFTESLNQPFNDLLQNTLGCCQQINKNEQIVLDEEFMIKLENQPNIEQIPTIIQIFNFNTLFIEEQLMLPQDVKIDKISNMIMQFKNELKTNYKEGLFDIFQSSSYKVRELLVFNLIKMQSIVQEETIQEFCENLLKQIWIIEKHPSVRNLLKNEEMIMMQRKLFSKDLQNFSIKLKTEMQSRLKQIQQLENQVLLSDNQDEMKLQLQQAYDNFEIYLDNITDMSQRLDISLIFLREISKDLKNIKSSIDQVLSSVKQVEDDVRRLRGKNFQELLNIRKQKVIISQHEQQLDQVHIQIKTQDYDPISGNKKTNSIGEFTTFLIANKHDDFDGEVNEFLWSDYEKKKDIMLIKGKAGSGKSRASRNIEELIWSCDQISPNWIPIYVSLPSLKDPNHNLIDQALESENYNFDKIQVREFKEAIINGNLKIVIILESYDEMKFKSIGTNLYQTNRLAQDLNIQASDLTVKIIITTRDEILNQIGYQTWFYGQSIETLKEIEILPFSVEQSTQYIKIYVQISIKRTVKRFYEFLKQLKDRISFQMNSESTICSIIQQQQNSEALFLTQDLDKLIQKMQTIEFFQFINSNQMVSLKKELLQLWGEQRFLKVVQNINIFHMMGTPFMMEIIVFILPKMLQYYSQSNSIRDILQKNFMVLKREAKKSEFKLEKYLVQQINQGQKSRDQNQKDMKAKEQNYELERQFDQIIEDLDSQNFFESFSLANSIQYINNTTIFSNKSFIVRFDANFIVSAFKLNQFNAFDFYHIFVNFYHNQQLQKLKDLGKSLQHESFLLDLQDISMYLAIDMTQRQITQVNYQQKGKLFIQQVEKERKIEVSWEDSYFSENQEDFEYKALLHKCMLINSKGSVYTFNHKSIQEYFVAKYLLNLINRIFINETQNVDQETLAQSSFNNELFNLSLEHYIGTLELLKPKITKIEKIKNILIRLASLSQKDQEINFTRSSSNSLYLLSYLKEHLEDLDLSKVQIKDTKLNGLSFYNCNLNNTEFTNVSIDSCNFNCATIEKANWKDIICKEKPSLFGHKSNINQIAFSDDGLNLISSSKDGVINLWQLQGDGDFKSISLPENQTLLTFSRCNNFFACLTKDRIYFFNPNDLCQLTYQSLINYEYQNLFTSSNGEYLAAETFSNQLHFWKMQNLQQQKYQQKYVLKQNQQGLISTIVISSNFQLIATAGTQIKIWNAKNIKDIQEILEFPMQEEYTFAIAFSNDSKIFATGGKNNKLEFWNIENLNQIHLLFSIVQQQSILQIGYSNDGKTFASRQARSLKLYDVQQMLDQQDFLRIDTSFEINLVEISPGSQMIACCHPKKDEKDNPKIQIWEVKNPPQIKKLCMFVEQTENITCLKFTNDNLVLGSGSKDKTICLWDLQKQKLIVKLKTHTNQVLDFGFSTDGTKMVSCSQDKTIIIWNIIDLEQQQFQIQKQLQNEANRVVFWPTTQFFVSFLEQFFLKISNYGIHETIESNIQDIDFSQNGEIMASLSKNEIRIWKIHEQSIRIEKNIRIDHSIKKILYLNRQNIIVQGNFVEQLAIVEELITQHRFEFLNYFQYVSVAQNKKFLVTGYESQLEITIIESQNPNMLYFTNDCVDFQFSKDSSLLAFATCKGAFVKNIRTNQIIQKFEQDSDCSSVCFIGQDQLAIALERGELVLYNIQDSQLTQKFANIQLPCIPSKISFLEQRQQIFIINQTYIILINLSKIAQLQLVQFDQTIKSKDFILDSDQQYIGVALENQICFIPLENTIIMEKVFKLIVNQKDFFKNSTLIQVEINSNLIHKQIKLEIKNLIFLTLNHKETQLIAIQEEEQQQQQPKIQKSSLFDIETNKIISCFEEIVDPKFHQSEQAIFSQDGLYFISSYYDLVIKLWDAKTCKLLSKFKSNTPSIEFIRISKRGIIAQVSEQVIKLWNLKALKQQSFEMDGHSDYVNSICIASDGLQLVSASDTEIIRWDLKELKKIDTLLKGKRMPRIICFAPNCQYLSALDGQQGFHIWKLNTKYIIEHFFVFSNIFDEKPTFTIDSTQLICQQKDYSKLFIFNLEQACKQTKILNQQKLNFKSRAIILSKNLLIKTNPLEVIQTNKSVLKIEEMEGIEVNKVKKVAICVTNFRLAIYEDHNYVIIIWSIEKKQQESILQDPSVKNIEVQFLAFSGNGKLLFSFHNDEKIRVWDLSDKFSLIKVQDLWTFPNSCQFLYLQIYPVKDEEFMVVSEQAIRDGWDLGHYEIFCYHKIGISLEASQDVFGKYSVGYSESYNFIAIQFQTKLNLYDISSQTRQLIAILEGNQFNEELFSSILAFSQNGKSLLSIGQDHTIRLWDITDKNSIKINLNLTKPVEALSLLFLDPKTIRIFSKSGEIIDQNISDFTQIGIIVDKNDFISQRQSIEIQRYSGKFENRNLQIFDTQKNELKYTLSYFSSPITCLQFTPSGKQFILGMNDGSILLYKIDNETLKNYESPVCYYKFAKSPLIEAFFCKIEQSKFQNNEKENLEKLFSQKRLNK
ncbi:unnamed protein product [Paramecium octaurelia]|uniref:Uncharacterized protein n=1 Tax=Paramecium octaurelia TaxID=43137 RepID=A0A8S1RU43_PAROT|nr:unnamed protein product [Paramecium octaurelia]